MKKNKWKLMLMRLTQYEQNHIAKIEKIKKQIKDKEQVECKQIFEKKSNTKTFKEFIKRNEMFVEKVKEDICKLKMKKELKENEEMWVDKKKTKRSVSVINKRVEMLLNGDKLKKEKMNKIKEMEMKKMLKECCFKPVINKNTNELAECYLKRISRNQKDNLVKEVSKDNVKGKNRKGFTIENICELDYSGNTNNNVTQYLNETDVNLSCGNGNKVYFENVKLSSIRKNSKNKNKKRISTFSNIKADQSTPIKIMSKRELKRLSSSPNFDLSLIKYDI